MTTAPRVHPSTDPASRARRGGVAGTEVACADERLASVLRGAGWSPVPAPTAGTRVAVAASIDEAHAEQDTGMPVLLLARDPEARAFLEATDRIQYGFTDDATLVALLSRLRDHEWRGLPPVPSRCDLALQVSELRTWLARVRTAEQEIAEAHDQTQAHFRAHIARLEGECDGLRARLHEVDLALHRTHEALLLAQADLRRRGGAWRAVASAGSALRRRLAGAGRP